MLDENFSPLECSLLDHDLGLREELEQPLKDRPRHTKECGPILFLRLVHKILLSSDFHHEIGSQIEHELILSKEGVLWQLQKWSDSLLIIQHSRSLRNKVHFLQFLSVTDEDLAGLVNSAVHADDQLVLKSDICVQEEIIELVLKSLEQRV